MTERDLTTRVALLENSHAGITAQRLEDRRTYEDQLRHLYRFMSNMKVEIINSVGALDDKLTEKIADLDDTLSNQISQVATRSNERLEPLEDDNRVLLADLNRRDGAFKFGGLIGNFCVGLVSAGGGVIAALKWGK